MLMHYINLCFNKTTEIIAEMHCYFISKLHVQAKAGRHRDWYVMSYVTLCWFKRPGLIYKWKLIFEFTFHWVYEAFTVYDKRNHNFQTCNEKDQY